MITIIASVDICHSIVIGGEASCQKALEGAEVSGEDILNFLFFKYYNLSENKFHRLEFDLLFSTFKHSKKSRSYFIISCPASIN